jgi:hypothetical protein
MVQRCGEIVEQVEQAGGEMMHLAAANVAEIVVEIGPCLGQVDLATPIDNVDPLVGMDVMKARADSRRLGLADSPVYPGGAANSSTMSHKMQW